MLALYYSSYFERYFASRIFKSGTGKAVSKTREAMKTLFSSLFNGMTI